ncbi:hypothetical protein B0H17DRAFT_1091495 [Mycena rosella]|uniref:Uncharacterized protein n=1 Tax=Mycena rosella TaxID=1033263 RepID=A0AAD7G826_MYCRO|nr:hypothetical protein B0H17DRAFT_1091495 [Mycena rosella]
MERILGFCKPPRNTLSSIFTMRFRLRRQKRAPQYSTLDDTPPNSDVRAQPSSHCPLASPPPHRARLDAVLRRHPILEDTRPNTYSGAQPSSLSSPPRVAAAASRSSRLRAWPPVDLV